jgi:hypothetical protein
VSASWPGHLQKEGFVVETTESVDTTELVGKECLGHAIELEIGFGGVPRRGAGPDVGEWYRGGGCDCDCGCGCGALEDSCGHLDHVRVDVVAKSGLTEHDIDWGVRRVDMGPSGRGFWVAQGGSRHQSVDGMMGGWAARHTTDRVTRELTARNGTDRWKGRWTARHGTDLWTERFEARHGMGRGTARDTVVREVAAGVHVQETARVGSHSCPLPRVGKCGYARGTMT